MTLVLATAHYETVPIKIAAVAGTIQAGGAGAAAGGWDTAGHRDTSITTMTEIITQVNALISQLRANGILAGGASHGLISNRICEGGDIGTVATIAGVIQAGGTGANAGGWDTSGHRDTSITTLTEIITQFNALLAELRTKGAIGGGSYTVFSAQFIEGTLLPIASVAGSIVAGGTGATGGCWDTAGHRDTSITTMTEIITVVNALLTELRRIGILAT